MTPEKGIMLVPHTHWDREWYEPFQVFRFRLVEVLDDVILRAEEDPQFRFTLDGQTAAIEDYLQIRPENTRRVQSLVCSGQLAIGPWQILLDEFLCSGETIIRNLEMGLEGARRLGGAMGVGYLPDMFGHVAQMPQILAKAGIPFACLWRGVPAFVDDHSFRWESPDGSSVCVEYLFDGYGNALDLLSVPNQIPQALRQYREMTRARYNDDAVLGMVGTDHLAPHPELMDWVREHNGDAFPVQVGTLEDYVSRHAVSAELSVVHGEMRSHARGNILPGVLSIRRQLKQLMAEAERTVTEAERLTALHSKQSHSPYFEMIWRRIIESTAHDSVVGSGTDETVQQVCARLEEAIHISRAVRDGVMADLAMTVPSDSYIVMNSVPADRDLIVELEAAAPATGMDMLATADGQSLTVQEIGWTKTELGDETIESGELGRIINRIHGRELFGQQIDTYSITPYELRIDVAEAPNNEVFDVNEFQRNLAQAADDYSGIWRVRTVAQQRRRILVEVPVPALGFTVIQISQGRRSDENTSIETTNTSMDNGLVNVKFSDDGTFSATGADGTTLSGVGRIVDGGDRGDSYNYGPPKFDGIIDKPVGVQIENIENGPLRSLVRVRRVFDWPEMLAEDLNSRSPEVVRVEVITLVELRRGERMVRLNVEYTNQSKDHRVRLHVPLPDKVSFSYSEGQFSVTKRGLTNEGGWGEFPLPTYPAYRFASAGPATLLVEHATEYEAVDGKELAVTLSRSVGSISVNVHPHRDEPAASEIPIPGAQEVGTTFTANFGLLIDAKGWQESEAVSLADSFQAKPLVVRGGGQPENSLSGSRTGLRLIGENIYLSSLRRVDSAIEARVIALSDSPTSGALSGNFTAVATTDLLGRELATTETSGWLQLELDPWEIRTLRLTVSSQTLL